MEVTHGGRVTLRRGALTDGAVEYEGELVTAAETFASHVRVTLSDGTVEIDAGEAPAWLVELARTTLRTAWRAAQTGTPFPRRVSRWRPPKDESEP